MLLSPFLALSLETVGGRGEETSTESWSRGKETKDMWQLNKTVILNWILDQKGKRCCWDSRWNLNSLWIGCQGYSNADFLIWMLRCAYVGQSHCLLKIFSHPFRSWRAWCWNEVKVTQSCPTLCDPVDCTVHGILQARILEWVAIRSCRGSSQPRDQTQVSHIAGRFFTSWATREAHDAETCFQIFRKRITIISVYADTYR